MKRHRMMWTATFSKEKGGQYRDTCTCGWGGRWHSRAGLAHSEFDAHLEQQEAAA